jgi:hypothetical protein
VCNQIRIRLSDGTVAIAKAEYRTGCVLGSGKWIPKAEYTLIGTIGCCVCGSIDSSNLIMKETWYGGRMACISCTPPTDPVCCWCRRKASGKIGRKFRGENYIFYYCHMHLRQAPGYNPEHDLVADVSVEELEEAYQTWQKQQSERTSGLVVKSST